MICTGRLAMGRGEDNFFDPLQGTLVPDVLRR
jgi:hypothetical protein